VLKPTIYLFLTPTLLALLLVEGYPIVYSLYLSLTQFDPSTPEPVFVGAENYVRMLSDPNFWISLRVTLMYVAGSVGLSFIQGMALAILLFRDYEYRRRLQTVLMLPIAVSPLIAGIVFSPAAIWDDINVFLRYTLHLSIVNVFDPNFAFTVTVLAEAWLWTPLFMLVFLSVLQSIPSDIFEAAGVHGASEWQIFRRLALPLLMRSPVVAIVVAIKVIDTFRAFEIPFTWMGWIGQDRLGSPIDTLSVMMYKMITFPVYNFPLSYIATIALTLLLISFLMAAAVLKIGGRIWGV